MRAFALGHRLPRFLARRLFGDRERFGTVVRPDDPCWLEWQQVAIAFYHAHQKQRVGAVVNDAGYRVMSRVDLTGRRVLEIGPGELSHFDCWRGTPAHYVLCDIREPLLAESARRLEARGVSHSAVIAPEDPAAALPFDDGEFDLVVSFYCLEHIQSLGHHVEQIRRVLRPGGRLVGAIPAEGGMAWGLGRFFTSRRWFKKHTTINPDKIICWEHPNFADQVLRALDARMRRCHLRYWPLWLPSIDLNLIVRFVYEKP